MQRADADRDSETRHPWLLVPLSERLRDGVSASSIRAVLGGHQGSIAGHTDARANPSVPSSFKSGPLFLSRTRWWWPLIPRSCESISFARSSALQARPEGSLTSPIRERLLLLMTALTHTGNSGSQRSHPPAQRLTPRGHRSSRTFRISETDASSKADRVSPH